jgi:tRNA pseudouridine38-40 synthase
MRNIKLTLAYDGTGFHGWQIQSRHETIQGALTAVVRKITQERISVHGASRTDAGVHALGQVAHFKTQSGLTALEFQRSLNALLPPAIRVLTAEEVGPDFHARWQAQAKTYVYRLLRSRVVSPFEWRYGLHYPWPLDEDAMAEAARLFEGEHDFTSFAASSGAEDDDRERNPMRVLYRSEILRWPCHAGLPAGTSPLTLNLGAAGGLAPQAAAPANSATQAGETLAASLSPLATELLYVVRGQSFLRYMVRKIAGTLIDAGKGKLAVADIPRLFELRDRSQSGATLPPQGLFLVAVEYPEPWRG